MAETPADEGSSDAESRPQETRGERFRRKGRRAGLYTWAFLLAILVILLVALVLANTHRVELSWIVGSTRSSLVWIIVLSAILGWLGGIATGVLIRMRTRRPR